MKEQIKQLIERVRPYLSNYWLRFTQTKFYTNKKIFFPVSISLGLILLIIIIGLIFGGKKVVPVVSKKSSPSPSSISRTSTATPGTDALSQIEQELTNLKIQITNLDVKQSHLQPPPLDFNIKF